MLYLVCAALLALAIGLSLLPEASAPRTPSTSIEDVATLRAATHEAGHAVAAWFCTGVAEIKYVKINGVGGEVRYSMFE
ncbi:MAG: hypothetical protein LUO93_00695, partial [Methanomicrobiales archaeon]|nr:hypothetical protein [Methanomicrobiales archaeon]